MQILNWGRARDFYRKHPKAEQPLKRWRRDAQSAAWSTFPVVRKTFNAVDWVDGKLVFDIKGNDYRLIAIAEFADGKVYIQRGLTHEEYDKGAWKSKKSGR